MISLAAASLILPCAAAAQQGQVTGKSTSLKPLGQSHGKDHAKTTTLQEVQVLGTHIRGVELANANPTITITPQQLSQSGHVTLGAALQQLPAIVGSFASPNVNNGGSGDGSISLGLHGLGPSRTLLLVDGQRVVNSSINAIPMSAVKEVQVLTNGASSIYGSDAIGGVIDVILKKNVNGAQFQTNYGVSQYGDGIRRGYSFTYGTSSAKGSLFAGLSYQDNGAASALNRRYSSVEESYTGSTNTPVHLTRTGDAFAPRGFITIPSNLQSKFGCANLSINPNAYGQSQPTTLSDYHCYNAATDGYQDADSYGLIPPTKYSNEFVRGEYNMPHGMKLQFTWLRNDSQGTTILSPPFFTTLTGASISQYSMYNPFGVAFTPTNGNGIRSILDLSYPSRTFVDKTITNEGMAKLSGQFDLFGHGWNWDVGYNLGRMTAGSTAENYPDQTAWIQAAGPSMLVNGMPACVAVPGEADTVISGCTPWDPFNNANPANRSVIEAITSNATEDTLTIQRTKYGDITGGLFGLQGGTVQLALGVDFRDLYQDTRVPLALQANPVTHTCAFGSGCGGSLAGGYSLKEAYGELFLPIVKNLPFAKSVSVDLGDRISKYSDFGSTNNWKIGVDYRPVPDVLLRGTVDQVFRAPTISNLFSPVGFAALFLSSDPCDGVTVANPACVGVPLTGKFVDQQVANGEQIIAFPEGSQLAGFPLSPEAGKSFDYGIVYSPKFVHGLTASADVWRVYLNNVITSVSPQIVLDACFDGVSEFCPLIHRNPAGSGAPGQLQNITLSTANLGRLDVKGLDFQANYQFSIPIVGQFNSNLSATYIDYDNIQTAPGFASNVDVGGAGIDNTDVGLGLVPRVQAQGILSWERGPWSASWRLQFTGKFSYGSPDPERDFTAVPGFIMPYALKFGARTLSYVQASYAFRPVGLTLSLGINNVFNKEPPILGVRNEPDDGDGNVDAGNFDVLGRYYWARASVRF